ncbi:MAG: succinate dehydrogenase [Anaerolineae bacterium]|nr:succinate dehydrogenase [Anaerolineae bacterium]
MTSMTANKRYGNKRRFEVASWYFMRVSGALLLLIAVFHLILMHVVIGVDNIDYALVVGRWASPWWRLYDLTLLFFALIHGANGARWVIDDYIHRPGLNKGLKAVFYVFVFIFLLMGTQVIFTYDPATASNSIVAAVAAAIGF